MKTFSFPWRALVLATVLATTTARSDGGSNDWEVAFVPWGDPAWTTNEFCYFYDWPAWMVAAFGSGGEWQANPPAWHVPDSASNDTGYLHLEVDRSLFSNSIFMRTWLLDTTGATLYVDLVNTNEVAIVTNLMGMNLLTGSGTSFVNDLSIPFSNYLDAVGIRLRRGTGEITVYDSALIINLAATNTSGQASSGTSSNGTAFATISGSVSYAGTQPGSIRVLAVTNAGDWNSPWSTTISDPGAYALTNLPSPATYWVLAYVDANANGFNDTWEAWGIGLPAPLQLTCATNVDVALADPDSNNDGLSDWAAMQLGLDPLFSNVCARLPFVELFETNTVHLGDIAGQNGWVAGATNTVFVQTNTVYAGNQALKIDGGSATASVYQVFAAAGAPIVWTDLRTIAQASDTNAANAAATNSATGFFFNKDGRLVVLDGLQSAGHKWVTLTNVAPVTLGEWVRITYGVDYAAQRWLICINATNVASNLGLGIPCGELHMFNILGGQAFADNLTVSTSEPSDLSVDGDTLPDVWELQYFGNYDQTDSGDPDNDGLTNLQEYQRGTNPNNADTDGDGMPDGWEVAHGLNPLVNDAGLDPDNDGLTNLQEYQLGTDPHNADTDGDGMPDGWEVAHGLNPLVTDAGLDPDNDCLTNLQEYQLGTNPHNADTDGDGLTDGDEVQWGRNPLVADTFAAIPWSADFETSEGYAAGPLAGQQGWIVPRGAAIVESDAVSSHAQAMRLSMATNGTAIAAKFFSPVTNAVVWAGFDAQATPGALPSNILSGATAVFGMDSQGRLCGRDGTAWVAATNSAATSGWTRLTIRQDFTARRWDLYVGMDKALANLSFADTNVSRFTRFAIWGGASAINVDTVTVATNSPGNVDANGNGLPDAWELQHFGNLDQTGSGDPDHDGLTNLQEYRLGTDPTRGDSNGDGIGDGEAVQLGLDPLFSNVCARLPFVELFETNTVHLGDIAGQNGWVAFRTNTVFVQTNTVYAGQQALRLDGGSANASVCQVFAAAGAYVVWADLRTIVQASDTNAAGAAATNSATGFFFNKDGRLVVLDGLQPAGQRWVTLTNIPPVALGSWARVTFGIDYAAQRWLICLNGTNAVGNLGFGVPCAELHMFAILGAQAFADNLTVSASEPADITVDGDTLPDAWEMQYFGNLDQTDSGDPDGDGLTNLQEYLLGTDPTNADTDGDGMPDGWEVAHGLNPLVNDAGLDPDNDGLTNLQEYQLGTDPHNADTDGDGMPDGWEVAHGLNPLVNDAGLDPDNDGLCNLQEYQLGTDPTNADTDGDGMPDGWEVAHGLNPLVNDANLDPDNDGLTNLQEYQLGTNPNNADTDGDGMPDGWEVAHGLNPLHADVGAVPDQGMVLWLRADDLVASNAVAVWPDRSGWGHDVTQSVASCRPVVLTNAVNGRPAVDFDGANDTLAGQVGGITGSVSVVAVCRFDSLSQASGDYDYILNMGEDLSLKHISVSRCAVGYGSGWDNAYYSYMGGSVGSMRGQVLPGQYWLAIEAVHSASGTAHRVYVNGVEDSAQQYTGTLTLNGSINLGRFAKTGYANHYLNGQIAEVFVYNRALGTNESQAIYAYLQNRYALKREGSPEVQAGADQQILEGQTASLNGSVSDDGEPNPPGQVTSQWTKMAGPGDVSFANAAAPQTTASFSLSGAYVLRLTASDGVLAAFDECQVTVSVPASTNVPTAGLRLWLKADGLPLDNGAPVAAWQDASGLGHDLSQADVGAQPVFRTNAVNGRPAVDFDGANDTLAGQVGGITGSVSVVTVCRFDSLSQASGDYDYVLNMGEDLSLKHISVSRCAVGYGSGWDNAYYSYMGGSVGSMRGPVLPGQQWLTIAAVHSASGTAHTVYLNGAPVAAQQYTGTLTLNGSINLGRFAKTGYANHYLNGQIAEVFVYDRAMQAQDMLPINAYLQAKYGMLEASDVDGDGMPDGWEVAHGLNPLVNDANLDPDSDGLTNLQEYQNGTDPHNPDTDGDGMPDGWEVAHGLNPLVNDAGLDPDNDGLTNLQEYQRGTDPNNADTDGDGMPDGWEVAHGLNPLVNDAGLDPDNDDLTNLQEYQLGTNPNNADTDGDGMPDGWEVAHGLNPLADDASLDSDNDGLTNLQEFHLGTDPLATNESPFPAWSHRMPLSFRDAGLQQPLTNFPVLVVLNSNRVNYAEFLPNGADLLFHTPDGAALTHEIEQWNTNGNSYVWVNVPLISTSSSGNFIMMRWGNEAASISAHSADVWNSDYVGVWHLADADNTVADSTRFAWNGINYGADGVTGRVGRAHHFDGASHIDLPSDSLQTIGNGVSVSLWLKGDNARCPIGIAFQASRNFGHVMTAEMLDRGGNVNWRCYTETDNCSKTPQANEYKDQWNHWMFVKNPAAGTMTIYRNGKSWATASGKTAAYEIADTFKLGSYWDGSIGYHGAIDEFRVAARPLSADWAAAEYRAMNDAMLIYGSCVVSVQAGQNGVEPDTNGTFVIHCSPVPAGLPLTVHYTLGGTARSGVEFSPMPGSVIIPVGSSAVTTTVAVIQNNLSATNTRTLSLTLTNGDYFISAASKSATIGIVGTSGGNSSLADSDGDGMPDSWETTYSLNPTNAADAVLDSDSDGVSNLNEYLHGLNPRVAVRDSDGDGLPDAEEISIFGTDPTLADTDGDGTNDMTVAMSKTGVETSYRYGSWAETNGVLAALSNRGMRAEYQLTPPEAGMYRLVTRLKNVAAGAPAATFRLQVLMDQSPVRWLDINVPAATNADAVMITTWLTATNHTLRFAWLDDGAANKFLGLVSLQLQQIHGSCTNASGHQDWMEAILEQGADTDGDGLSDYDEVNIYHTDPLNPDTDGDTLGDGDEVNIFLTDPLTASSDVTLAAELDGTNTVARNYWAQDSEWYEVGTTLVSPEHWGSAVYAYDVATTNAGMQRLAMQIRAMRIRDTSNTYDLPDDYIFGVRVTIDGFYVGVMKIKADLDQSGTGYLTLPWLAAGNHRIEVQWQDWFSSWLYYLNGQGLRRTVLGIEKLSFYAVEGADANTNGIPDWMERAVNPALDTDGDGLSDRDEMLLYHTNPLSKDTDHDGLSDKQELLYGTDPLTPDSDSDGVLDGEEVLELHTNPHQAEFDGTVTNRVVVSGFATNAVGGSWVVDGTELLAQNKRGWVQYGIDAPQADIFRVCVQATHVVTISQCSPVEPVAESDIVIYVDGRYLGKKRLVAPQGIYGTVTMFTPYLPVGPHTVKLYWENVNSRIALKIKDVTLQQYGGADANSNGVKDWVETSLAGMNTLDAVHALPSTLPAGQTCVSPVCIEGAGPYADMMSVSVNGSTNLAAARSGILDRWYADVPLSATGSTAIAVAFQDGAFTRSTNLTWVPLNVLDAADLTLRQNDTLMLTAAPSGASNGTVTIQVLQGATLLTNLQTTVNAPVTYTFASAGTYTISGAWQSDGNGAHGSLVVTVVGGAFPSASAACMIGYTRQWSCTNMSASAVLESDDSVSLLWTNQTAMLNMSAIEKAHYLVARAWQGGPILASSRLDGFWIQGAVDSYMWVVETYQDGSALWENSLVAKNVPDTVAIELKIIVGGVTFDDMSLERWITSSDLNALGEYTFRMIKPASVGGSTCHTIRAYQGNEYLGEAYYGGILMPTE